MSCDEKQLQLLQNIYVAQVLLLAEQINQKQKAKGITSTGDYLYEAVKLVRNQKGRILEILASSP